MSYDSQIKSETQTEVKKQSAGKGKSETQAEVKNQSEGKGKSQIQGGGKGKAVQKINPQAKS
ncbi:MAG: hypothetical protein Q7J80_09720 [Anaerolineales bacterium]|nr:hypothetical protein [Anaerolineales bacterium]